MKLLLAALATVSFSASAYMGGDIKFPPKGPSASDWAIAMTAKACKKDVSAYEGAQGIVDTDFSQGKWEVLYTVVRDGNVLDQSVATNNTLFARRGCVAK